jgi:hypothetical protein
VEVLRPALGELGAQLGAERGGEQFLAPVARGGGEGGCWRTSKSPGFQLLSNHGSGGPQSRKSTVTPWPGIVRTRFAA